MDAEKAKTGQKEAKASQIGRGNGEQMKILERSACFIEFVLEGRRRISQIPQLFCFAQFCFIHLCLLEAAQPET